MENKKSSKIKGIISLVILAMFFCLYNICVLLPNFFITGFYNGATFWTSYLMMLFVFVLVGVAFAITLFVKADPKDAILRIPIFYHTIIFFVVELIATSFFMALDTFFIRNIFLTIFAILLEIIISTVFIAILISCFFVKSHIQKVDAKVKDKTNFIRLLKVDVDLIAETAADPAVREAYMGLSEQVRYSDPMSHESLFELEKQILECLSFSKRCVEENKNDAALKNCEIASRLLFERNEKTKVLK
ncbi:MAG: hypothetical protein IKT55_03255 [Clostridia bacterium]|nr:hypothetical protein [Clostridia bacterium]